MPTYTCVLSIIGPPRTSLMPTASQDDSKTATASTAVKLRPMTAFVESCVETIADSAHQVEKRARGKPRAKHLLKTLADKRNILITTHRHPDPDAMASSLALSTLIKQKLPGINVDVSIKGNIVGG